MIWVFRYRLLWLGNPNPEPWPHGGNRAVRIGDKKLVSKHSGGWELYNMTEDRTETNDLSGGEADRVRTMAAIYQAWADRCEVRPWPLN